MLGTNDLTLDEVSDAAYIYAVWDGKPKVITDATGRTVTLYRPVKRIVTEAPDNARMLITLGAGRLLVGADRSTVEGNCICPGGRRWPAPMRGVLGEDCPRRAQ